MPVVERVHHIGIAVADLEAAEHVVRDQLGLRLVRRQAPAGGRVRAAFYDAGNVELELLWQAEPSGSTFLGGAPQARLEHVALQVRDLGQAIAALRALGVELAPPREGPIGASARTLPASSGGITYQVLQFEQPVDAAPGGGRAALEDAYGALLHSLSGVDDGDGWQATRCSGWVVRDLVQHLLDDARRGARRAPHARRRPTRRRRRQLLARLAAGHPG
ncbi:MAG: VOC family protein, partial [Candidatus Dormiibacterota bacterium]